MRVASFFSGIGGFDLGLERAGMEIVFQCEISPFSRFVLQQHWPRLPLHDDISTLKAEVIPESDLWCAGFPCQDVSLANQGKRQGLKGERSGLFFEFAGLIERRRPRWVFMENVPGLLNSQNGEDFRTVVRTLDELGYGVAWRVLDAKFFRTPQRRRRVFLIASYRSASAAQVLFDQKPTAISFRTSKGEEQDYSASLRNSHTKADLYTLQHASIGRNDKAGPQAKGYRNDGETWTLDSRGSSDAVCATNDAFRIREASGLPRWVDGSARSTTNSIKEDAKSEIKQTSDTSKEDQNAEERRERDDSNRYRCAGNAVAVPVIEWIGRRIIGIENSTLCVEPLTSIAEFFYPAEMPMQMGLFVK